MNTLDKRLLETLAVPPIVIDYIDELEAQITRLKQHALQDCARLDFLQSLVDNPSHPKEGVTICTKWPGGVMVINPADIRAAIDVIRGVVP
jgi:hypothetical protein